MSELEELLERAEAENQRLRDEVLQLRGTARHQAEIIEGYVNQGIARKQEARLEADADAELFRMLKDKPPLSDGALHVIIGGGAGTEYQDSEDEVIDDMPGAISEERNKAIEAIMLVTAIMMLIVILAIWWRVIL